MERSYLFTPLGIGLGHVSRSLRIANMVKNLDRNSRIYFATYFEPYHVSRRKYPTFRVREFDFFRDKQGSVDYRQIGLHFVRFFYNYTKCIFSAFLVLRRVRPDAMLVDSATFFSDAERLMRHFLLEKVPYIFLANMLKLRFLIREEKHNKYLVALANKLQNLIDLGYFYIVRHAEAIAVPDFPPPYTISAEHIWGMIPSLYRKVRYVGPILPPQIPDVEPRKVKMKLGLDPDKPLIYIGISGPATEKRNIKRFFLQHLKEFPGDYSVVFTWGDINDNTDIRNGHIIARGWIRNRLELMLSSDVYIGRGGAESIKESIALGVPMISIPTRNHIEQIGNAKKLQELGAGVMILEENLDFGRIKSAIEKALSPEMRRKVRDLSKIAKRMNGVKTVARKLVQLASR